MAVNVDCFSVEEVCDNEGMYMIKIKEEHCVKSD